ncbi:uncharacterized protein [Diadema setosum]|uniref:uncharacterized protein n=1 Tax=Diadema setosum TaxID=31175 RepID=UPI003B3AFD11
MEERETLFVGQSWETSVTAPRIGDEPSGLFNLDMDLDPGNSTVEGVVDSTKLMVDPSATSTVDLAELFPDLTDILDDSGNRAVALRAALEEEEAGALKNVHLAASPDVAVTKATVGNGLRRQLPSTSSCASGSEMSDYEEGLSPAEVDTTLENFFNTFTDIQGFLDVPAEETGPTATVDAATVRSLIDTPTNDTGSSLSNVLTVDTDSLALSAVSAEKRIKSEGEEEEEEGEENACHVAKKSRRAPSTNTSPVDVYRQRRIKNNIACKRARQNRKKRENDLVVTANELEAENAVLRAKIEELTEIAELSRRALVKVLAK